MPRQVTGNQTVLVACRLIVRMVDRFGAGGLTSFFGPELSSAVAALVLAVKAFEALDDYPGEIDRTPGGQGDNPIGL
jgi:hypothetical protein